MPVFVDGVWAGDALSCRGGVIVGVVVVCWDNAVDGGDNGAAGANEGTSVRPGSLNAVSSSNSCTPDSVADGLGFEGERSELTHPTNVVIRMYTHARNCLW